ncbi:MAG: hypothetical protein K2X03_12010 [Bryobacteraceae bacterium]|nr:hypothetical protein [Bryobacteraceae bacterium]
MFFSENKPGDLVWPLTPRKANTSSTYSPKPSSPSSANKGSGRPKPPNSKSPFAQGEKDFRKTLPNADPRALLANGIAKSEQILKLYLRYDAQLNRLYRNCLKDLRDLQAQRHIPEPEEEATPIEPKSETEAAPNEPKPQPTPEEVAAEAKRHAFQRHININLGRPADYEPPA